MNPKTTGILFAIAAALGAFVLFYEIEGEEGRKEAEEVEKRLFPDLEPDAIESIVLPLTDDATVRLERRDGRWQIVEPIDFAADTFAADGVASALVELKSESLIDDPRSPEVYGLDAAGGAVRFRVGGVESVLRLGDDTPLGSNSYVAIDGSYSWRHKWSPRHHEGRVPMNLVRTIFIPKESVWVWDQETGKIHTRWGGQPLKVEFDGVKGGLYDLKVGVRHARGTLPDGYHYHTT